MTLNVIAAILTMTGYSTNDTIVIFDRVRENLRSMRRDSLHDVINVVDQPDARPDGHHRGHGAAVRARAVLLRRRGAARVRVHDDRRHHHRHLLERVHRRGDRQLLARSRSGARRRARARRRPRRPPAQQPTRSRSRSARPALSLAQSGSGFARAPISPSRIPRSPRCSASCRGHRIPAGVVDRAPADRRAAARVRRSGRRLHRHDPARRRSSRSCGCIARRSLDVIAGLPSDPDARRFAVDDRCSRSSRRSSPARCFGSSRACSTTPGGDRRRVHRRRHRDAGRRAASGRAPTCSTRTSTRPQAFGIGLCQMLALIPGVSRSGATIVGVRMLRAGPTASAGDAPWCDRRGRREFSFFLAMPTMAAFAHDLLEVRQTGPGACRDRASAS